jgi:DNA damage-binding protein 1
MTARHKYCVLSFDASQQIITESSGEIGFPGQPSHECLDAKLVIDPTCRYFATTLYESTVTIVIPETNRTKEHTNIPPQTVRKMNLRAKDGRRRQTQDLVFQHPHDYINIRYK